MLPTAALTFLSACGLFPSQDQNQEEKVDTTTAISAPPAQTPKTPGTESKLGITPVAGKAKATIKNPKYFNNLLRTTPFHAKGARGKGVKIAILDNGFAGWEQAKGVTLPAEVDSVLGASAGMAATNHGTGMAELIHSIAPEATLIAMNANGLDKLEARINDAIRMNVDMILYSQVWEYGGNFDGGGFINRIVNRALDAGIVWVNATGNYGIACYNAPIENSSSAPGFVKLPDQDRYLRFEVPENQTPVKITLAWNDFRDEQSYRTNKDLNLVIETESGEWIGKQAWIQDGQAHPSVPGEASVYSQHAREIYSKNLNAGRYRISIENASKNFDAKKDTLRLAIDGMGVAILDMPANTDSVMIPADNPRVFAVGASDVIFSSQRMGPKPSSAGDNQILLPHVYAPSLVTYTDGSTFGGSSTAAATAAASMAVYWSAFGKVPTEELKKLVQSGELSELRSPNAFQPAFHRLITLPAIN